MYHAGWITLESGLEGEADPQPFLKAVAQPQYQNGKAEKAERQAEAPVWGFQQALV